MVKGFDLVNLVEDYQSSRGLSAIGIGAEERENMPAPDSVQVRSPLRPLQTADPSPADLPSTTAKASSSRTPAEVGEASTKKRKRKEKKEKAEKKKERKEEKKKKEEGRSEPPCPQPRIEAAVSAAEFPSQERSRGPSEEMPAPPKSLGGSGARVMLTGPALQLHALEAQLVYRRNELLVEPVVEAATVSSLNLLEYIKVNAQTQAHMAAGAQRRALRLKEVEDKQRAELEKSVADLRGRLFGIQEEQNRRVADLQTQHLQALAELEGRKNAEAADLRRSLEEAEKEAGALASDRDMYKMEAETYKLLADSNETASKSLAGDLKKAEGELQFAIASRDRLSRDLAAANERADSLFTYDTAVRIFQDSKDYEWEVRDECNKMFTKVTEVYEATFKRLIPGVSMDRVLAIYREEAIKADRGGDEGSDSKAITADSSEPETPQIDVAETSRVASAEHTPSPPADRTSEQQQQQPSSPAS